MSVRINNTLIRVPEDYAGKPSRGAIACMINTEISAVLAVMRRNVRWGFRYIEEDNQLEHSLIQSLKELRKQIFLWHPNSHTVNPIMYLQPFLDVIQSDETGAPITGVALSSVNKILTLGLLDLQTVNVQDAMHLVVDSVTSCRFEVTDPGSEEVVLMKILQVLLACMKSNTSIKLSNQHVCNIVAACFRIVRQASDKSELLQRIARNTMHELIRCIFLHLHDIESSAHTHDIGGISIICKEVGAADEDHNDGNKQLENGVMKYKNGSQASNAFASNDSPAFPVEEEVSENKTDMIEPSKNGMHIMMEPYGIPCMVEIFQFLCSLLNAIDSTGIGPRPNPLAYDEDVPLFALGLINAAIELSGHFIRQHPNLLSLVQKELFHNLMQFGLSPSPLLLSMVCNIVLNLYHHLRMELKLQLEAFFSCVLLRVAESRHGSSSYQQHEVAMEALVDLCRQPSFSTEMYVNYDCDISFSNVFEEMVSLFSKSAFPVNVPLSFMHVLALNGLIAMIQGMAERAERVSSGISKFNSVDSEGGNAFWAEKCENYCDPKCWVPYVRRRKFFKRKLMICADHFNRDSKKGLEFLQRMNLSPPDKLDPRSVAYFLRYTKGLDKSLVGDFLGNHDEFCIHVLHEFAKTFDFKDLNLDTALRIFLESFRLPGESQKIQRAVDAFAERYYEQSPQILANQDAALLLSYSIILLNTDQHNPQVKKKMSEHDFIRNNRRINGGSDLPRELLSDLYRSISENEIRLAPEPGGSFPLMTPSCWIGLLHNASKSTPYIVCDAIEHLDHDMFSILSGPTIAAISVVFDHTDHENVVQICTDGFLAIAKISACYHLDGVLDDLVVSLCKFTTLLGLSSIEDTIMALGDESNKARMATTTVFFIANNFGDYIRSGWKNILECILSLQKLSLLSDRLATDSVNDPDSSSEVEHTKSESNPISPSHNDSSAASQRSSGLMGRFSQFWSFDADEPPRSQPSDEELAAHERALRAIQSCNIDAIFSESMFLQGDSLMHLLRALTGRSRRGNLSMEDEGTLVFCMELIIIVTVNNRDRILLLWGDVYEHISAIVQSISTPCTLVEKAVFGLLRICQRLLPYKDDLSDELLKSLNLILKLDARVADVYCEHITREVTRIVIANVSRIRSPTGWRAIVSLISISARHPDASEAGYDVLDFVMSNGAHLIPENFILCVDAATHFAESWVGPADRSIRAVDLMVGSVACLVRWSNENLRTELREHVGDMWVRLVLDLKRICLDRRTDVRSHALLMLQRCLLSAGELKIQSSNWTQCFDSAIFALVDDLMKISKSGGKDYTNIEGNIIFALELMSKVFLQFIEEIEKLPLWVGILSRLEECMKVKFRGRVTGKMRDLVPEILKNNLLVMKCKGVLGPRPSDSGIGPDCFWDTTWVHVKNIDPELQRVVFPDHELEEMKKMEPVVIHTAA